MNGKAPTNNQIETLYRWVEWYMSTPKAVAAMKYLKANATRGEVSREVARIYRLKHSHKLDEEQCFASPLWKDFKFEPSEGKRR